MPYQLGNAGDLVAGALAAFHNQLEHIRREHFAKNRSSLQALSTDLALEVERMTVSITNAIVREIETELRNCANDGEVKTACQTLSLMLS